MTPVTLPPEILQMSVDERIELACAIWDSIAENAPIELTEAQKRELDRRLANRKANPGDRRPWEEFKAEMLGR
jgi:putative addiction module component (TIGR02574 family)